VETLLIHAADDPFLPACVIPHDAVSVNPRLWPLFVARGGHVGFVTGHPWRRWYWAETRAAEFLAARRAARDRNLQGS
jgi:predicted alpha/beta-fold hydrolase